MKTIGRAAASVGTLSILPCRTGMGQITGAKSPLGDALRRKQPNVIFVLTDDQGFGDLGCHGNPVIKTPNLDKFAGQSVEFSQFYVCPVCSPTRASLMTGRYNYRTKVAVAGGGWGMMAPQEVTIAETLRDGGYATAIFGKWHLGDNYPMRTIDQGFDESIVHKGGGIGYPDDPPGNSYFDPILQHNGKPEKFKGYCMDIYTDATIKFIENNKDRPFFVYLSTNTVHTPLQISDEYVAPYKAMGLTDKTARVYGMVTNIDDNFSRLLAKLKESGLEDNTIVIFMSDNGPSQGVVEDDRYSAGLRGLKGMVYENGIRVPCFIRWPADFKGGRKIDRIAAHIDIMPTLLEACGLDKPKDVLLDGVSLMPLLRGDDRDWPDRTLYFQWHRRPFMPQLYRCFAARNQKYKLVQAQGLGGINDAIMRSYKQICRAQGREYNPPKNRNEFRFELFDISKDPLEKNDISAEHPEIVAKMKADYQNWFNDVTTTRGFDRPETILGTPYENPTMLTPQGWRRGGWAVQIANTGKYTITLPRLTGKALTVGRAYIKLGKVELSKDFEKGTTEFKFENVELRKGLADRLQAWIELKGKRVTVKYVDVKRLD